MSNPFRANKDLERIAYGKIVSVYLARGLVQKLNIMIRQGIVKIEGKTITARGKLIEKVLSDHLHEYLPKEGKELQPIVDCNDMITINGIEHKILKRLE